MWLLLVIAVLLGWAAMRISARIAAAFPRVLGAKPPHIAARNTAIFGIALTVVIYCLEISVPVNDADFWKSMRVLVPIALVFLGALGFVAWRLWNGPDKSGVAMGIAFPAALLLVMLFATLGTMMFGNGEQQMGVSYSILFAFMLPPGWGLFVYVMVPTLIRLLYKSIRASATLSPGTRPNFRVVGSLALVSAIIFNTAWLKSRLLDENSGETFRVDKTRDTIDPLYMCLWQLGSDEANGRPFPDSIGATRSLTYTTGADCARVFQYLPEKPYTVAYERPTQNTFRLTVTEKTWRKKPVHKLWVDQTGVLRSSVRMVDGREDSLRVQNTTALAQMLLLQRMIDDYAAKDPRHEYPRQVRYYSSSDTVPAGALAVRSFEYCASRDGSCVRTSDHRKINYSSGRDASGRSVYSLLLQNDLVMRKQPIETDLGDRFRSYLRDERGVIHAYGGARDATRADPPPQPDELSRARERSEQWYANVLHSQRRDSLGRAVRDSVHKFRADSARLASAAH